MGLLALFESSAESYGLLLDDKRLSVALLVAAVCQRDDVARMQIYDLLAEHKGEEFAQKSDKSIRVTRRQWKRFDGKKRDGFRREVHHAGYLRYSKARMSEFGMSAAV